MSPKRQNPFENARAIFQQHGGTLRTSEALKFCRQRKDCSIDRLLKSARICPVENIMPPYMEALL